MMYPHSSVGKKSACNAGDPSSIPRSGRSTAEGIGYPLQYSWASLVAQLVKNLPAMRETWVWFLGWATHSSILAWRIPWTIQSMGSQRVRYDWATFTFTLEDVHEVKRRSNRERLEAGMVCLESCHSEGILTIISSCLCFIFLVHGRDVWLTWFESYACST